YPWGLAFSGATFACTVLACLAFYVQTTTAALETQSWQWFLFGRRLFSLDELSAPLVPAVALLHFVTVLATPSTKMRRFSLSWSLTSEAIRLAAFSSAEPWVLIALLV